MAIATVATRMPPGSISISVNPGMPAIFINKLLVSSILV
jgi:hypothetical protein